METNQKTKTCEVCQEEKPIGDFSKSYKNRCKKCVAEQVRNERILMKQNAALRKEWEERGKHPIDWEQRRYEVAKDCCAVLMTCENLELQVSAEISVKQADALIAELKKGDCHDI